jgi:hypothetical protein
VAAQVNLVEVEMAGQGIDDRPPGTASAADAVEQHERRLARCGEFRDRNGGPIRDDGLVA